MDRTAGTCSSSCNSSAGLQFKRRPNEEGQQVGLRDRAARKERERERLRELLNRGKKKRRRISSDKLLVSPAIVVCDSVPRKPRSVRSRRKAKSWASSHSNPELQPPSASPTGKSPPLVQNEVEMEIAEVLFGLQKQESPPVTVQNCEPLSINAASELDKPVLKQEVSTVEEGLAPTSTSPAEAKSERQGKFVIDLMKPPPDEFWPEECSGVARSKSNLKTTSHDKELGNDLCSIKKEAVYENQQPPKTLIKAESRDFDQDQKPQLQQIKTQPNTSIAEVLSPAQIGPSLLSHGGESHVPLPVLKPPGFGLVHLGPKRCITHRTIAQSIYKHQQTLLGDNDLLVTERILRRPQGLVPDRDLNCARDRAQAIEVYLRSSDKAGPFVFPFSQNQTAMTRQSEIPLSASSSASMRFSHPNGAPFLAVLPEFMGKKTQQTGGRKSIQPVPFFDRQLLPAQMFYPVQIQQPRNFPSAMPRCQRNMTSQSLHAGRGDSMSSFPFAYARQGNSTGGPDLNFSLAPNSVCPQGFSDNFNQMQYRSSQVFQGMNRGEFMQAEKLSFAKQNALPTRAHMSNSSNSQVFQQQQMLHAMAASQLRLPPASSAKVSKDFAFFSGNLFDRSKSSHSLQQRGI